MELTGLTDRLFDRSPIGMAIYDADLRYARMNAAMGEMTGVVPDEAVGRTTVEVHGERARFVQDRLRQVLSTGRAVDGLEVTGTVRDGRRHWVWTCVALGDHAGVGVILGDVTERRQTEAWLARQHARNALLAGAARELDLAQGTQGLAQRTAELAVPALADWALLHLVGEDGILERAGMAHADPARTGLLVGLDRRGAGDGGPPGFARVMTDGRPEVHPDLPDARLAELAEDPARQALLRELGCRSVLAVPLVARGRALGTLVLVAAEPGRFGEDELLTARLLAELAALALDGASMSARQARVAAELQAGLLPPALPDIPGVELAARYRPASAEVGGDFYDAFPAGDDWVVLIGDVAGKGPAAAAVTGLVRHTLRAAARYEASPADALLALNDAMLGQLGGRRHCTAAVVLLEDAGGEGVRARVRCAGHPPPLVLRADGGVEAVGQPGHPLGILAEPVFLDDVTTLRPGDTLLLYTDGVTEAGGGPGGLGEEGLAELLGDAAGSAPGELLERIERAVQEVPDRPRDDLALIAARIR